MSGPASGQGREGTGPGGSGAPAGPVRGTSTPASTVIIATHPPTGQPRVLLALEPALGGKWQVTEERADYPGLGRKSSVAKPYADSLRDFNELKSKREGQGFRFETFQHAKRERAADARVSLEHPFTQHRVQHPPPRKPAPGPTDRTKTDRPDNHRTESLAKNAAGGHPGQTHPSIERTRPSTARDKLLDDRNRITTLGELADFLNKLLERDVDAFKQRLGQYVEDGDNPNLVAGLAIGADLFRLVFSGMISFMRLGADAGAGEHYAGVKEALNLLSFPGIGSVTGLVTEGVGAAARASIRVVEEGVEAGRRAVEPLAAAVERAFEPLVSALQEGQLLTEGASGARWAERAVDRSANVFARRGGPAYSSLTGPQKEVVDRIAKATERLGAAPYDLARARLKGEGLKNHHLALNMLFQNGPRELRYLQNHLPAVPITGPEHVALHEGLNGALAKYWDKPLSRGQLKDALTAVAKYYDSCGLSEWAQAVRTLKAIAVK